MQPKGRFLTAKEPSGMVLAGKRLGQLTAAQQSCVASAAAIL